MSGVWLDSAPEEHQCRLPILWPIRVRTGDRWKCRCGRVWRVTEEANGRMWTWENPPEKSGGLKVFRPVTDEQLKQWLDLELGLPEEHPLERWKVVEAIQKHFEIGSKQ